VLSEADRSLLCQEMDVLLRTLEEHGVVDPRGLAVRPQTPPAKHPPRSHGSLSVWGEHAWGASVVQGGGSGGSNVTSNSLQGSHVISKPTRCCEHRASSRRGGEGLGGLKLQRGL